MARFRFRLQPRQPHESSRSKARTRKATAVNTKFHFPHAQDAVGPKLHLSRMSAHVILLTDAHEAPAYGLIEALRGAGVKTLIEGLREVEVEKALAQQKKREGVYDAEGPPPLAVLYEVVPGADMVELHTAIDHAKAFWPGAPLIACRRQTNGYQSHNLRSLDGATLKRIG